MQHVLIPAIVGFLVGHPAAALHSYGVTAAEVVLHLGTVTAAFIVTALEVPVFVEDNLSDRNRGLCQKSSTHVQCDVSNIHGKLDLLV